MSNQNFLTITPTNYPNSILLGKKPYQLNFQITSTSHKSEQVRFQFTMEGIEGKIPNKLQKPITIESGSSLDITIPIIPTVNGSAKLVLESSFYKEVKYTEKVWHIRTEIPSKRGKEALSKSFVKFKDLTKGNKKTPKFKNGKSLNLEDAVKEYESVFSSSLDQIEKDAKLGEISKRVFNSDMKFAFEVLKMVQNQASIQDLLADLIVASIVSDRNLALSKLPDIKDKNVYDALVEKIIPFLIEKDLNQSIQLCKSVNNVEIRDALLRDIFQFSYLKQFNEAMQLVTMVTNPHLQLGLYYELIKILNKSNPEKRDALMQNLIQKCISTNEIEILSELLLVSALSHNPQRVANYIDTFPQQIKESVNSNLQKYLWEEVEEEKIRVDEVPISSLYYAFNVMVKPSPGIAKVAELGGTVSSNLIDGKMNSVIGMINLFSFNFPVYPTIEQCYAEINAERGKSFYYLIIPLKNADDSSYEMVQKVIKSLFVSHAAEVPHNIYIFNLDFIPYLAQPTIIVEDDPEENIVMQSIVKRVFKKDNVSLIIDDGLFKGGKINTWIKSMLPQPKFKLLNLVLTYDFLNDHVLLKKLMNEFVR